MSSEGSTFEPNEAEARQAHHRKPPPEIDDSEPDRPAIYNNGQSAENPGQPKKTVRREPISYDQFREHLKFEFGRQLILLCLLAIIVLSVVGYMMPRDSPLLQDALNVLKLIATTALGFVFARALDSKDASSNDGS